MNSPTDAPFVQSIFHPSDFSEASLHAFAHALAIGLIRQTELTILHSGSDFLGADEWTKFPPVRKTLERWGLLEPGSDRAAIFDEFQLRVQKVNLRSLSPLSASMKYLKKHPTDLIVLSTHGREGVPRWIRPSKAERLAHRAGTLTLFVPESGRGFVSLEDGGVDLSRVLSPIDHGPNPAAAITYATRAARALRASATPEIVMLHVGETSDLPPIEVPKDSGCSFRTEQRDGPVVDGILQVAREIDADMIAMTTQGHDGFLDALRGSVTDQVLRGAPCPLLAVPAE